MNYLKTPFKSFSDPSAILIYLYKMYLGVFYE